MPAGSINMYRTLLPVFLYVGAVSSAPQDGSNSDITYVKIQPFDRLTDERNQPRSPYRESRIEILPLTVPGNPENNQSRNSNETKTENLKPEESIRVTKTPESQVDENNRHVRSEVTTTSYESETADTTEPITERDETLDELIKETEEYETRTKAPAPRFLSKLSYFKNSSSKKSPPVAVNLIERSGKRKFRSKCRCEKIWNCPKLQITVPRCPNEYFLCCF